MPRRRLVREMNTQARKMSQELLVSLEDLIQQTDYEAMLGRKLRNDEVENDGVDHEETLLNLELANKHLKMAREFLGDVSQATRDERLR